MESTEVMSPSDVAALVATYQAQIWRYLRFLGCAPAEAEDLTQETFLSVIEKPFADVSPDSTGAYLRAVARNLFLKRLRKARTEVDPLEAVWARYTQSGGWEGYIEALHGCLESLDSRAREALDLRYRDNASREVLAKRLGMEPEGAKTFLRRIKERLKRCIEGKLTHE
ncbi:MAG: sigma-70 family RNA polymerase sigma factor [Planctomycetes bacterium]|nr:sigma-70 family RNA polymerase sigma factor [Planctomycetota bacterium]